MKRSTIFLSTILCLFLSAPVEVWAKDSWVSVRSENFFLIGNASEKEIRQVAARLEQFREVFSRLFDRANLSSPVPTRVVVFKNDKSYDYLPRYAASCVNTREYQQKFRDLFESKQDQTLLKRNIQLVFEEIETRVAWLERDLGSVQEFFK